MFNPYSLIEAPCDGRPTVLLVDDTPNNLQIIRELLKGRYRIKVATDGEMALRIAGGTRPPDIILLDVIMPVIDGYEVCRMLKESPVTREIPVIFLTSLSERRQERVGLELGAADYVTKPVIPEVLLARVETQLRLNEAKNFFRERSHSLERMVRRRTRKLYKLQEALIVAMGSLAETRDNETGNHIRRTRRYVEIIAQALVTASDDGYRLSSEEADLIAKSAPLHDIGKVGVPDSILLKPGRLDDQEFEVMKQHTELGRNAILAAEAMLGEPDGFLHHARDIVYHHHERWDGSGYPEGLAGAEIPLAARIMALADTYDALISRRVYKPAYDHATAIETIRQQSGRHFDPCLVELFMAHEAEIHRVAQAYAEESITDCQEPDADCPAQGVTQ